MRPRRGRPVLLLGLIGCLVACSTPSSTSGTTGTLGGLAGSPIARFQLPGAVAVNLASNGVESPIAVWTTHHGVTAAVVDLGGGELRRETEVAGGLTPFPHPIERPAATVGLNGEVTIAFVGISEAGETIYMTRWDRETTTEPEAISGPPRPETVLVHATNDPDGQSVLTWLESSTLSVGLPHEESITELEEVDDLTCDCCNPVPFFFEDSLFVAYRDLERVDGEVVRDAVVLAQDGDTWTAPVVIADDQWFIDACPFSGPSAVVVDGAMVVAWMDARQTVHPDQAETTIWVDRSESGIEGFGADLATTSGGRHRWPVMAVDAAGTIHLIFETQGSQGGLSYATSEDGGRSFSDPKLIVQRDPDAGSPTSPTVIVHDQRLLVSWADRSGGHIAVWPIGENVSQ